MKKLTLILLCLLPFIGYTQVTLYRWSFNTRDSIRVPDAAVSTGTRISQTGNGSIQLDAVINTYGEGVVNDSSSIGDNSAIQLATFPINGTRRDTAGIIFRMSTTGHCNLFFSWYQRHSATSSRFVKLLYTIDGVNWMQYTGPGTDTTNSLYRSLVNNTYIFRTADFSSVAGVNNNPLFALKIVSTFSPNGSSYVGTTSAYATSGNYRFDLVQLRAHPIPKIISPKKLQILSSLNGNTIVEGNYQSIISTGNKDEFYLLTGKGSEITQDNIICDTKAIKINPLSSKSPKLLKININTDSNFFSVLNERTINYNFRKSINGNLSESLAKHKNQLFFSDTISDCMQSLTSKLNPYSENGYDPNGLIVHNNNFWFIDEMRSAFVCLNSNYKIVKRVSPFEEDANFSIDQQLKNTTPGFGFKSLTQTPNQLLYSISAKPLKFDSIINTERIHRLIAFNPSNNELTTYLVLNSGAEGGVSATDWTIEDIVALNNEEFLIYEQAENQIQQIKRISKLSIKNATPVVNKIYNYNGNNGPVELLLNEIGLATNQIIPATKSNYLDLIKNGLPTDFNQVSSIHLQNDSTLLLLTNNNNGLNLTTNQGGIVASQLTESKIAIVKLTGDLRLNQVNFNNNEIIGLNPFSLDTQLNNKTIALDSINFSALNLTWTSSSGADFYAIAIDTTANIEQSALSKYSLPNLDTSYQINYSLLKQFADEVKLKKGDSIAIYLTLWSYKNLNDSLPSIQTLNLYLKSPLIPEKFTFINPSLTKFEANRKMGNALNISWTKSNYANTYALSIDTSVLQANASTHLYTVNTSDTALTLSSIFLDSLAQIIGVQFGDSVLLTFNIIASNNQGNSLKISDFIQVNLLRADKILGDFSILNPTNGFKMFVNPNDTGTIELKWTASDYATGYVVSVSLNDTKYEQVNAGNELKYHISIADILSNYPLDRGDTLNIDVEVYALFSKNEYNDTLKAMNDINGSFIRLLIFDSIAIIKPAPYLQLNLAPDLINQTDSLVFEWSNPNPFAVQQLHLISENLLDTISYKMQNSQTRFALSNNQLYDLYLGNTASNDSVFVNWNVSDQYRQFLSYSENRRIGLKKLAITGIYEFEDLNKIMIYPNPSNNGIVTVKSIESNILNVTLFDQSGALVPIQLQIENMQAQIHTNGLLGMYYLRIQFQNKVCMKPILIGQ